MLSNKKQSNAPQLERALLTDDEKNILEKINALPKSKLKLAIKSLNKFTSI